MSTSADDRYSTVWKPWPKVSARSILSTSAFGIGCLRQQPVTGLARRRRQTARRLVAAPGQNAMRDAVLGAEIGDLPRLDARIRPQAVVDRHREQPGARCGPVEVILEEEEKGGRVAAAGYGCNGAARKVQVEEKAV